MSKSKGQSRRQGYAAVTQNGWTKPLAAFIKRFAELRYDQAWKRAFDCNKALTWEYEREDYARWLMGIARFSDSPPVAPPENPPPEHETDALKAILHFYERFRSSNLVPPLPPDQAKELDDLHSPAIRAMKDRLRQLQSDDTRRQPEYVTLDQMAAVVNRSKRTLERFKTRKRNPLPPPNVEGGGGKPDEWIWSEVRPWLEAESGKNLPEHFPGTRLLSTSN
jgi:hypothetical protein